MAGHYLKVPQNEDVGTEIKRSWVYSPWKFPLRVLSPNSPNEYVKD